jgi:phage shock protein E
MHADGFALWMLIPAVVIAYWVITNLGRVSQKEAARLLAEGAVLLDVRSAEEVEVDGVPGALNVPVAMLSSRAEAVIKNRDQVVLCFCLSGARSASAVGQLKRKGYKAFNLGGAGRARAVVAAVENP